jgi:hypothetical protein
MWNRSPDVGDQYCTGGKATGEICGWQVIDDDVDVVSSGVYMRHVVEGKLYDTNPSGGTQSGDSGGAVYTYRSDGTIAAKGVHSSHGYVFPGTHYQYFTDIWYAYQEFPGVLRTTATYSRYELKALHSGKCLDVQGGSTANGAKIIQYSCHGGTNQRFYTTPHPVVSGAVQIRIGNGKCLAISANSNDNSAPAVQWTCDNLQGQTWFLRDDALENLSGKCLDIQGASQDNSAFAIQYNCKVSDNQKFKWHGLH